MLLIKSKIQESNIQGLGLFADEKARKGQVIGIFPYQADILTESEYQNEQEKGNKVIAWSAVRWIGDIFLTGDSIGNEERINHSTNPTMLYHCGICFAWRNIEPGEELTVDYKYFLAEDDVNKFTDSGNNEVTVDGIDSHTALLASAKDLVRLLNSAKLSCNRVSELNQ